MYQELNSKKNYSRKGLISYVKNSLTVFGNQIYNRKFANSF